jgi:hypothetical protein
MVPNALTCPPTLPFCAHEHTHLSDASSFIHRDVRPSPSKIATPCMETAHPHFVPEKLRQSLALSLSWIHTHKTHTHHTLSISFSLSLSLSITLSLWNICHFPVHHFFLSTNYCNALINPTSPPHPPWIAPPYPPFFLIMNIFFFETRNCFISSF